MSKLKAVDSVIQPLLRNDLWKMTQVHAILMKNLIKKECLECQKKVIS